MRPRCLATPALLALALSLSTAHGQTLGGTGTSMTAGQAAPAAQPRTGTRNTPAKAKMARGDRKFVDEAAGRGMYEVQIAQLAVSKASDPAVKNFASMLVDQHAAANDELVKIADARGVELPPAPGRWLRRDIEKLAKKNGDAFDRAFVRDIGIEAHEKDIKTFEKAGRHLKDPELKAWVDKTLPVLRDHLAAAGKLPQAGRNGATMGANKR